jgi:hypothetical protein
MTPGTKARVDAFKVLMTMLSFVAFTMMIAMLMTRGKSLDSTYKLSRFTAV